jgi:hypothetical protein
MFIKVKYPIDEKSFTASIFKYYGFNGIRSAKKH